MGSVHLETLNQGRGSHELFDYVPFSDAKVVSELIRNRMSLDVSYKERVYPGSLLSTNGGLVFNENILTVFIDLDNLIENSNLSKKQNAVVQLLMRGWTIQDIADETGMDKRNVSDLFKRAVARMTSYHKQRWLKVAKKLYLEEDDGEEEHGEHDQRKTKSSCKSK